MEEIIKILIKELKQQHSWRLEEDCGRDEISESWDMLIYKLKQECNPYMQSNKKIDKLFI